MRTTSALAIAAASVLLLSGCAAGAGSTADGEAAASSSDGLAVVASTNVYGDIVRSIGGDAVQVTSLIDSGAQDPHSFEPSARDQLAVSRAALIVENGGGYDPFMDSLVEATGTTAPVITAVDLLDDHTDAEHTDAETDDAHADDDGHGHVEGLNEHVWYDPHVAGHLAEAVADELTALLPDDADAIAANLAEFEVGVDDLETSLADLAATSGGAEIFVTEPVPLYLTDAAGLENVAPDAFTEAVEEGQDVPPATLLASLDLIESGDVRLVIVNAQTSGAETERISEAATAADIPVVAFTETLPEGKTYLSWMAENVETLAVALAA